MKTQKGFYVSLALGCLALFGIGVAYYNTQMKSLSETVPPKTVVENGSDEEQVAHNIPEFAQLEPDIELDEPWAMTGRDTEEEKEPATEPAAEPSKQETKPAKTEKKAETKSKTKEESSAEGEKTAAVGAFEKDNSTALRFKEESGLAWPLKGEILLKYCMDSVVYFNTLNQYKCNPALLLKAEQGTPVQAAAKCYVTDIKESDETGLTVTTSIGSNYEVIYGQLDKLAVKKGDMLEEGDLIGYVAAPTAYYTKEGANLWLQVRENDETVDPLLCFHYHHLW